MLFRSDSIELIDADFNDAQLRSLLQSAAIYASPHASEGFGLTIAEAMAAGVLVVATDYGGTHDLLDPDTGFPVKFNLIAEPLGFGSYQEGCVWAKVDEKHLSEQLRAAAQVSESAVGLSIRQAAQIKLASRCSLKVVAKRIDAALQEIL